MDPKPETVILESPTKPLRGELRKALQENDAATDARARVGVLLQKCAEAVAAARQRNRRAYVVLEMAGDHAGPWVEVFPGVRGPAKGFTRNRRTGAVHSTLVQVCAATLLAAMEKAGLITRTEAAP